MTFDDGVVAELPRLRSYARMLVGGVDADDLTQQTAFRALNARHLFVGGDLRAWMFTIMHNQYVSDVLKSVRSGVSVEIDEKLPDCDIVDADVCVLTREISGKISQLEPRARRAVEHALRGLSYVEIGRRENVPIGTVRSRLHRGRSKLREFMGS